MFVLRYIVRFRKAVSKADKKICHIRCPACFELCPKSVRSLPPSEKLAIRIAARSPWHISASRWPAVRLFRRIWHFYDR